MKPNSFIFPSVILTALTVFLGAMEFPLYATISAFLSFLATLFLLASLRRVGPEVPPEIQSKLASLDDTARRLQERAHDAETEVRRLTTQNESYAAALEAKTKEATSATAAHGDEQAVVQFVRNMQERGRLLDFLMADIHALPDQQVGAVARVVHSGLKSLVDDYFSVQAISHAAEGSTIEIPADEIGRSYRLIQSSGDEIPTTGTLVHKGWHAQRIRLPKSQRIESPNERLVLAYAEVDIKPKELF